MEELSKTTKLAVIILALELLGELTSCFPRLVRAAAAGLGISRKAGYKAARRIRRLLARQADEPGRPRISRETISLRIRNQILLYERDHPGVRFGSPHVHLPGEARSLCVRLLREYRSMLPEGEIADLIGVSATSLRRWDEAAGDDFKPPPKPDLRGKHRRAKPDDVAAVLEAYHKLQEPVSLEAFTISYNEKHAERPLDRRTITRILQREGLRQVEIRAKARSYHERFKVYFPGAQVSLDAKEIQVLFTSMPQATVVVTKEVAIDIASCAIVGDALQKEEDSQGVVQAIVRARKECASIIALLADNGSANRSDTVRQLLERDGTGQIFSFPVHPQTNGHVEGLFGEFSRVVGTLHIDDTSRETVAASIAEVVFRVFEYFHNYSPRRRLGGLSPLEYLRNYSPRPEEIDAARQGLQRQKERSESLRGGHPRLVDPTFRDLLERTLERCGFGVPKDEALRALLPYDHDVIESAACAFVVQSQRQGFDERKRTFAYFLGIVGNKQKDTDTGRLQSEIGSQKTARIKAESEQARRQVQAEEAEEEKLLRLDPQPVILQYVETLLRGRLRFLRDRSLERLRRALRALKRLGRATEGTRDRLASVIQSWGAYGEDLKAEALKLFYAEYGALAG